MKLKLVVASMSVLGLISCPVFADETTTTTTTQTAASATDTAPAKHKHHHHMRKAAHHHHAEKAAAVDYKDMGGAGQPAPVVEMPRVDIYQPMMDGMTQSTNRAMHASPDWYQRIGVTGGVNFDAHWGNLAFGYNGENNRRLSLNDAYVNVTALVNDWTKAFASLSFNNTTGTGTSLSSVVTSRKGGVYSNAYTNNKLDLEQGYVTIGNFDCSPFFVQLGKQFQDFGRYQIHPIERTMAQVLSESLQTSAKIGFVTRVGLHGAAYIFDNTMVQVGRGHTTPVYGASLGFDMPSDQLGFDVGAGYMSNMIGVSDVAGSVNTFELAAGSPNLVLLTPTYNGTVGAYNVYADFNTGPFWAGARYTSSIQTFSPFTLSNQFQTTAGSGARPWAVDATVGYGFNAFCKNQNVYVGYQASNNAVNLLIPRNRWIAGYDIDAWKYTTLGLEYGHDQDYSSGNGGTGRSSNTVGARASVKFG